MTGEKSEHIAIWVTTEQKDLIQRAANLEGRSLNDYVVGSVEAAAEEAIRHQGVIKLSREDSIKFVEALLNPPEPSPRLRAAYQRYRAFIAESSTEPEQ